MGLPFNILGEYSAERNDIIFSSQIVAENYDFGGGKVGEVSPLYTLPCLEYLHD